MPQAFAGAFISAESQIAAGIITDASIAAGAAIAASKLAITQQLTLLKANSGTDTNAAATNVDTIAISGLTAKDTVIVYAILESVTQVTAEPNLYNNTDAVKIRALISDSGSVPAGATSIAQVIIRQAQSASTKIYALLDGADTAASGPFNNLQTLSTFTTAWTGSWTLALRHNGVTAGGTFKWSWAVFKVAGQ